MTVTNVTNTTQGYQVPKTGVNVAYEIADFLFGVKSIERIIKGQGSWGDLVNVGVTAATFLIPPAKLLKLKPSALIKIATASEKTAAVEGVSVAARRAAQTTADNANEILRMRSGERGIGGPLTAEERAAFKDKLSAIGNETRTTPTPAALAEQSGKVKKGEYSRTPDEEYDPFNRDTLTPQEQIDDLIASENPNLKPDEYELAMRYDKRKFTEEEIQKRIDNLSVDELVALKGKTRRQIEDYVRKGEYTDKEIEEGIKTLRKWNDERYKKDTKEISRMYLSVKNILKFEKENPGTLKPATKELFEQEFPMIKKEFETKVYEKYKGEKILEKVNKELPEELPSIEMERSQALKDLYGDTYELAQKYEISADGKMVPRTSRLTEEEILKFTREDALPQNPLEGLTVKAQDKVKRAGKLQAEMEKYENFNKSLKANRKKYGDSKNPEFNNAKFNETAAKIKEQKNIIAKYQKEFNQIKLTSEERDASIEYAKKLRAESFAKRNVRRGSETSETKNLAKQEKEINNKLMDESFQNELLSESINKSVKPINSFRGENSFLSNMADSPVELGGIKYPTVEHAFQAAKTTDPAERLKILKAKTPAEAKKIGRTLTLRKNWNQIREEVMEKAVRAKFEQNPELAEKLIKTGKSDLIEGNTWGDTFWGVANGKGENKLGKILMKIREELIMKGN